MNGIPTAVLSVVLLLATAGSVAAQDMAGGSIFNVSLAGSNETDGGDPDGSGQVVATLNQGDGTICVDASYATTVPITGAHIHRGAPGEDGPVVVGFIGGGGPLSPTSDTSFSACTSVDADLLQSIADDPAGYYFNIHNAEHPVGAIRGALAP